MNCDRIAKTLVVTMVLVSLGAAATADRPLDGAKFTARIYGPKIKPRDIKGRVIFFEYWGSRCPPCRTSFPHLVALQKKFAPTGKFTVIASHVQADAQAAKKFCASQKVNFSVYQQLRLKNAPCGRGIPSAYLFDHTGKIAAKGHPATLYRKVASLVKAVPNPLSTMIGDLEPKHFRLLAKGLVPGRAIRLSVLALERATKSKIDTQAKEAKAIHERVHDWIEDELARTKELSKTQPTKALQAADRLVRTVRRMPEEKEAADVLKPLKDDPNVRVLATIAKDADALRKRIEIRGQSRAARTTAARLKKRIEIFLKKDGLTEAVKTEAGELLKSLQGG